ncbi:alpha/beta fold hydrolase [Polaromonas sp.]|uniref:YheT family hydrolase n=1 Tax=Polaromonas sp. TaxID=1869339 RepID=UPI0025E7FCED|nr:alpha/beta fold hydrolase [Polaromonas sp.]
MNYVAPWWLPGGNLQTIWAALRSRRFLEQAPIFKRERWTTPDNDFVDVDWLEDVAPTLATACAALPPEGAGLAWGGPALRPDAPTLATACAALPPEGAGLAWDGPALRLPQSERPLLVVFHGLEGSSASHYAEAFADVARSRGWACAVPHFRGCSGELNLAPRAYHSGDFAEIDWILRRFAARHTGPVLAVGISLGGNALMRWAAESGAEARQLVAGLASVCSPLDLAASGWAISRGFNRQVYTRMFLRTMVPKALQKLEQHPGLFDRQRLLAARDLYEFDNVFTAPVHGFKDADDYWARASAKPHLHKVAVPALVLNALNDPFVPASSLPQARDTSSHVTLWQPAQGGHVGFPSQPFPGQVRVMPEAVTAFLAAQLEAPLHNPGAITSASSGAK